MKLLLILFLGLNILSCKSLFNSSTIKKKIWISSIKKINEKGFHKYQIQESEVPENGKWTILEEDIENFQPQFGQLYRIEVKITEKENFENGIETKYKLIKILDKKIDTSVKLNDIWGLYSMNGRSFKPGTFGPRIEINLSNDKMVGKAFCNQISCPVNALNNKIKFGLVFCTRMACKDLKLENQFLKILEEDLFYKFGKNELILYNSVTKSELRFKKLD